MNFIQIRGNTNCKFNLLKILRFHLFCVILQMDSRRWVLKREDGRELTY